MSDEHIRIVSTREEAHAAITQAYQVARALVMDGKRVKIAVSEANEPVTLLQRRFYHGPVLTQIAEQVRVAGERYVMDIWKEYYRKLFLPDKWEMRRVPVYDKTVCRLVPAKRATPYRVRVSTEDLGVKKYSEHIDKVIAHASTDLNVVFHFDAQERNAVRYRPPQAKQPKEPATC